MENNRCWSRWWRRVVEDDSDADEAADPGEDGVGEVPGAGKNGLGDVTEGDAGPGDDGPGEDDAGEAGTPHEEAM
jgi:hypothetical protein